MKKGINIMRIKGLEVSDLYLAVFIKTKYRLKIVSMKRDGNRITFVFDLGDSDGEVVVRSFYNGDDMVKANDFVRELKDMKALIHSY